MEEAAQTRTCPSDEIAAYVDGELSAAAAAELEVHVAGCAVCARVLREQRQFLAALSASLDDLAVVDLPGDFTRRIVSNAESTVAGVRRPNELFTAVFISLGLLLFVILAFGRDVIAIASLAGTIGERLFAVGALILKMTVGVIFAIAVVSRSIATSVDPSALFALAGLAAAAVVAFSSLKLLRRRSI